MPFESDLKDILRTALPAAAAAWSAKKGQLGTFGESYLKNAAETDKLNLEKKRLQQEGDYQTGENNIRLAEKASNEAHYAAEQARAEAEGRTREMDRTNKLIGDALSNAAENPDFMPMVNSAGPENFSLTVPGIGAINLKDAFARVPVIQGPDGSYQFGRPAPDPMVNYETVNDDGSKTTEMVRQSVAAKRGPHVTSAAPKATEDSFSIQTPYDEQGRPQPPIAVNTKHPEDVRPVGGAKGAAPVKPAPGAAADAKEAKAYERLNNIAGSLDQHIDAADAQGLLGPSGGRIADALAGKLGSTGDPAKDELLGQLRFDFNAIKPRLDLVLTGTTRGAASPQLAKTWNDIFAGKISKAGLKGALKELRAAMGPGIAPAPGGTGTVRKYNPATGKIE